MQAVILAAGKSTRTHPLTVNKPKCLLKIANTPIMEYHLEALRGIADEIIVIVGFGKEQVNDYLEKIVKDNKPKFRVTTIEQKTQGGTGHALWAAKNLLNDKFLVLNGDDLYTREDMVACIKRSPCVSAAEVKDPGKFGVLVTEGEKVLGIKEKPKKIEGNLVNTGLYCLDTRVFEKKPGKSKRGEIELTDMISGINLKWHKAHFWSPVGYPWDVLEANEKVLGNIRKLGNKGKLEKNVTIKGNVWIGEGSLIKSGCYIEGPVLVGRNTSIGPNCHIRPCTTIGDGCNIAANSEIKNSVIGDNVKGFHVSYIGDSVIGDNANIGGGTVTANLRHDKGNVKSIVKGKVIDSGRRKLGAIIGEGAKIGIGTKFYPGRKVWPGKATLPGEIVKKDVK